MNSRCRLQGDAVTRSWSARWNSRVQGYSGEFGNEGGRFIAVGGNGSWDSGGYSRGDRVAPILLDLRPLDELLNPINFPDQPDIYTRVRAELEQQYCPPDGSALAVMIEGAGGATAGTLQ